MISYIVRWIKRLAVLVPGLVIAWLSVYEIFPFFDRKLPLAIAIFVTYVLAAYVLVPSVIRLARIVLPARHLPFYCVTPDGFASDPVNIGLIGTRQQLIRAMEAAGWYVADPHTIFNIFREILSTISNRPYLKAPMSSLYLFGRKQDIGFEKPLKNKSFGGRHHVRFWATTYEKADSLEIHNIHWYKRKRVVQDQDLLWVGAASRDVFITFIKHNVQITHLIDPDTNRERNLISTQLKTARLARTVSKIRLNQPYRLNNRAFLGYLRTDGVMYVLKLLTKK